MKKIQKNTKKWFRPGKTNFIVQVEIIDSFLDELGRRVYKIDEPCNIVHEEDLINTEEEAKQVLEIFKFFTTVEEGSPLNLSSISMIDDFSFNPNNRKNNNLIYTDLYSWRCQLCNEMGYDLDDFKEKKYLKEWFN